MALSKEERKAKRVAANLKRKEKESAGLKQNTPPIPPINDVGGTPGETKEKDPPPGAIKETAPAVKTKNIRNDCKGVFQIDGTTWEKGEVKPIFGAMLDSKKLNHALALGGVLTEVK